jgi:hypothetical protein
LPRPSSRRRQPPRTPANRFPARSTQPSNKLDLFRALQDGSVLLVNTAKDLLKTEGSQLFGRFIIKMIVQAALERSTIAPDHRTSERRYGHYQQE